MVTNRTFTMLKPDSLEKGNTGAILGKINTAGFKIVAMKQTQLSKRDAETFYAVHNERPDLTCVVPFRLVNQQVVKLVDFDGVLGENHHGCLVPLSEQFPGNAFAKFRGDCQTYTVLGEQPVDVPVVVVDGLMLSEGHAPALIVGVIASDDLFIACDFLRAVG